MCALPLALVHTALSASTDTFINRAHKLLLRTQTRALAALALLIQMEIVCRTHIRLFGERWKAHLARVTRRLIIRNHPPVKNFRVRWIATRKTKSHAQTKLALVPPATLGARAMPRRRLKFHTHRTVLTRACHSESRQGMSNERRVTHSSAARFFNFSERSQKN